MTYFISFCGPALNYSVDPDCSSYFLCKYPASGRENIVPFGRKYLHLIGHWRSRLVNKP